MKYFFCIISLVVGILCNNSCTMGKAEIYLLYSPISVFVPATNERNEIASTLVFEQYNQGEPGGIYFEQSTITYSGKWEVRKDSLFLYKKATMGVVADTFDYSITYQDSALECEPLIYRIRGDRLIGERRATCPPVYRVLTIVK